MVKTRPRQETARPGYVDARHLLTFRSEYAGDVPEALLLHDGAETYWLTDDVLAVPWWRVL